MFAGVTNDMTIAREIFGPVIAILPYKSEEEVIRLANQTIYGLAAYVQSSDIKHARAVASQMRASNVHHHLSTVAMLQPSQIQRYAELREYAEGDQKHQHH